MSVAVTTNCVPLPIASVPVLKESEFRNTVLDAVQKGARISSLFAHVAGSAPRIVAVLSSPDTQGISFTSFEAGASYRSLTPDCPQAHWFEREIFEQYKIAPEGHPWPKPIRFQGPMTGAISREPAAQIGVADFFRLEGSEAHEVAVGPVHAGIIEPGHFRFQCHGENVHHLEISLGYQHRGIEEALVGGPTRRTIHYMETLAGDTTIGHTLAYCQGLEALGGVQVPARACALRAVLLELERLANHTGDLGALANDVGYLPTASFCGRIRGDFLNMTALLCGNRFGRNAVRPGGTAIDADDQRIMELKRRLETALKDVRVAVNLLWESPSVMARFERTGAVSEEVCREIGLVGPAARACGLENDVRRDFPVGWYAGNPIAVGSYRTGDVFARAYVRWLEIQNSAQFIFTALGNMPSGEIRVHAGAPAPGMIAASLSEGWRGEICHVAVTGIEGKFSRYKVTDPSFHNWFGLSMALRKQQISDFPLCNKSFNLSYCGHDL